jgi:hypothetical protein
MYLFHVYCHDGLRAGLLLWLLALASAYKVGQTSGNSCIAIPPPRKTQWVAGGGIEKQELPEVLPTL